MKITNEIARLISAIRGFGKLEILASETTIDLIGTIGFDTDGQAASIEKHLQLRTPDGWGFSTRSEAMVLHVAISGEVAQ